jgi:hypothetical protein
LRGTGVLVAYGTTSREGCTFEVLALVAVFGTTMVVAYGTSEPSKFEFSAFF